MADREYFDHYRICRDEDGKPIELGRGAMATTYMAEDPNLRRNVALKVINVESLGEEPRRKFETEARAAALLQQGNVAAVHHLGSDKSHFFYAMEHIDGETAEAWVNERGPMPVIDALKIALQVSRALAAASRHGLTHRDIKPSNLMLCRVDDGEWPIVKVIDFGLATAAEELRTSLPANVGFHGTAQYASPEQAQQHPVDVRSDIYSLGCTLWFLLTGQPPFSGSLASIFAQNLNATPPFRQLGHFPRSVRKLLEQMLKKNRDQRPSPPELAKKIQRCLGALERQQTFSQRVAIPFAAAKQSWVSVATRLKPVPLAAALIFICALAAFGFMVAAASKPARKVVGIPEKEAVEFASENPVTKPTDLTNHSVALPPSNRALPPAADARAMGDPSIEKEPADLTSNHQPDAKPEERLNGLPKALPRDQVLASYLGTDSSGRWMFSTPDNSSRTEASTAPTLAKSNGSAVKKHPVRAKSPRSNSARPSSGHPVASAARKIVGFLRQ